MAVTLVINPGSSSKKYALFESGRLLVVKHFERDGSEFAMCTTKSGGEKQCQMISFETFQNPLRGVVDDLVREHYFTNLNDVTRVGVRVVAPGSHFQQHTVIDDAYLLELRRREATAPLHISMTIREIEQARMELPHSKIVAVSDSAFHKTMPPHSRQYSIDRNDTAAYDIYRFGYHGLSVSSIVERIHAVTGVEPAKAIVAHIGSGVSLTALRDKQSIDTTMGFAPSSGLVMGTRAGDIEPGALLELMRVKNMGVFDTLTYLNTRGGLFGVGGDSDLRQILEGSARGDVPQTEALALFTYHIKKTIGAYTAALGGLDVLVLTATAAERNPTIRAKILAGLESFGILVDREKNEALVGKEGVISTIDSPVKVAIMRTDEMGEIARVTERLSI